MQAYVLELDTPIAPFNEPAHAARIGGVALADYQQQVLQRLGFSVERIHYLDQIAGDKPCLVLRDHVFVSHRALKSFVRKAQAKGGAQRLALPNAALMQRYHHLQQLKRSGEGHYLFDVVYLDAKAANNAEQSWHDALPLQPAYKEMQIPVRVPANIVGHTHYVHPLTTTVAMHVRHWVHILWANNLLPQIQLVERMTSSPLQSAWRLARSLGFSRSSMQQRAMQRFCYIGKRCKIHPTARVELSILGDDVEIGAFALVRGSVIGSGSVVEDRANVLHTTLGPECFVSRNSTLVMCAGYENADLCVNGMQFSLAGRNAALTSFVRPMDMRYRSSVAVLDNNKPVTIDGHMLGTCFGHRCFIGPDIYIHPGREIPNGAVILPAPELALSKIPREWPEGQIGLNSAGVLTPYEVKK